DLSAAVFVCPSSHAVPDTFEDVTPKNAQSVSTWASVQKNLSYSYQVPFPSANARASGFKFNNTLGSDFAIVSDLNPGGEAVTKIAPTATKAEIKPANSRNHQGDGQN